MAIWTTDDLARRYGVTRRRAEQLCKEGRVHGAEKVGRDWIIQAQSVRDLNVKDLQPAPAAVEDAPDRGTRSA